MCVHIIFHYNTQMYCQASLTLTTYPESSLMAQCSLDPLSRFCVIRACVYSKMGGGKREFLHARITRKRESGSSKLD